MVKNFGLPQGVPHVHLTYLPQVPRVQVRRPP